MTYDQAKEFRMPYGKHKGKTLDEIAQTDDGLSYLDYMHGEIENGSDVARALSAYCTDPTIAKEIDNL